MNQKMKLVAAVVAGLGALTAQAGQLAGNPSTIYAAEAITNTANVPVPTFTYQTSEPINGPASGTNTIYVVVKSTAGTWRTATATGGGSVAAISAGVAPTLKLLAASSGSNAAAVNLDGTLVTAPVVINGTTYTSSSGTGAGANNTLVYSFTIPTGAIYGLGSNFYFGYLNAASGAGTDRWGFLTGLGATLGMGAFDGCNTITGGAVDVTLTIGNNTGGVLDTIAPYAPTKTLIKSAQGVVMAAGASADTAVIDAVAGSSKVFVRTTAGGPAVPVNLGTVKLTDAVPGTTDLALAAYNVAALNLVATNSLDVTVTGDFAAAGSLFLSTSSTCASTIAGGTSAFNTAKTQGTLTYTMGAAGAVSGTALNVCYTPNTTTVLTAGDYTVTAQLTDNVPATPAAFNYGKLTASSVCPAKTFTTSLNASKVIVRNYSPAAVNVYGWGQYTRIINNGSQDAAVSGYFIYGDGTTSASKVITAAGTVKKGGNVTLSNTSIEASLGPVAQPAGVTTNPRLVITSPTSALRVQNYIVQPNGAWFETSAGQTQEGTAAQVPATQE